MRKRDSGAPTRGARPWELGQWPSPTDNTPGGRLVDPPGQGTPCRVPSSPRSATVLDVSPSLDGQTTFKSDETKTIMTVSKRTSQRRKNYINTMSALQKKPQKPKEMGRKDESTRE